jgi:GNAT superfamily N-acetyltransferase
LSFVIRSARPDDAPAIVRLIKALAEYERLLHEVVNDEARVHEAFFSAHPKSFCDIAEIEGEAIGHAIWFYSYSTFTGRHGIYLEDLYVAPEHRGAGIGKAFLKNLAERCVREKLTRFEWSVLDWNEPSIGFYRSLGAVPVDGWIRYRLDGEALARMGSKER